MRKRIIFCKNAVETLTYFSRQLARQMEAWGYEAFWMDVKMLGLSAWKLRQAARDGQESILITFNFIGLSGEEELWDLDATGNPTISIWEKLGVCCLNIMVDHPIYYYKALRHPVPGMCVFCVDRDHVSYMRRFYPEISSTFLPLAGNCLLDGEILGMSGEGTQEGLLFGQRAGQSDIRQEGQLFEQWMERPYPVVFTANYVPVSNIDRQLHRMAPEYQDFYYEIIDAFIQNPRQDLLSCIESYLRREMPGLSDAEICEGMSNMPAVDLWIRTYFREKTVRMLVDGGIKVHIFGKDWDKVPCRHPENMVLSGHMAGSADCVQAMARGKVALNTMPWFKDGAHDRIFTAMLQGAAALTDGSAYLREQFQDMETLFYYSLEDLEGLPQQVAELSKNPQRLFEVSRRGKSVAERLHTWGCRAGILKGYFRRD